MITRVPSGFIVQPDSVGDTGPSDFAKAVRDDGQADAAQVLTADGFERGYQQLWINSSGAQLIDFVYQFRSASGAQTYAQREVRAAGRDEGKGVTTRPFAVRGVSHSLAVLLHAPGRFAAIVLAETGPYFVQMEANATAAVGLEQRASNALKEQAAKL